VQTFQQPGRAMAHPGSGGTAPPVKNR